MADLKAPCGHLGVVVIGTYIQCAVGCEADPTCSCGHKASQHERVGEPRSRHCEFPIPDGEAFGGNLCKCSMTARGVKDAAKRKTSQRRGVSGHVDWCACKHCQIRRRGRTIHMRTKEGKDVQAAWDGVSNAVKFVAPASGILRHWKLLDEDGDVVADGMFSFSTDRMVQGAEIEISFNWHDIASVKLAQNLKPNVKKAAGDIWRQAAKRLNFGLDPGYRVVAQVHDEIILEFKMSTEDQKKERDKLYSLKNVLLAPFKDAETSYWRDSYKENWGESILKGWYGAKYK